MITLRFSTLDDLTGRVVQWATWSWASHVDVVLTDGSLIGAIPKRGVVMRVPDQAGRVEFYHVQVPAGPVIERMLSQIGRPYDWPGIMGWALRRDWQDPHAWFCSELVAWAFENAGFPLLRSEGLSRITPRDLLMSPMLRKSAWNDRPVRSIINQL
jgi:uncharacterized protein YycO